MKTQRERSIPPDDDAASEKRPLQARLTMRTAAALPLESDGDAAMDQEEFLDYRAKLREGVVLGFWVYLCFAVTDYLYAEISHISFWNLFRIRLLVEVLLIPLIWLIRRCELSRLQFRLADTAAYTIAATGVALMCVQTGGLTSVYFAGVMLTLIARSVFISEHWRNSVIPSLTVMSPYPLILIASAYFVPEVREQFHDQTALYLFIMQNSFILCIGIMASWAGHSVWALRRKVYESRALGRYKLERRIGSGGMGEVWSANHPRLRRKVAIKILRTAPEGAEAMTRFEREFAATSQLSHPNTVRVFDYGVTDDGILYYVMELLDGEPLSSLLTREGAVSPARSIYLVDQAARALGEAHQAGICHRDVKPDNLYVTWSGEDGDFLKVLDFGVAKEFQKATELKVTQTGAAIGTPEYMSPEVARGEPADARSDVYALGVVLYYCLTGKTPFEGDKAGALLFSHINVPPPSTREVGAKGVPEDLERVVMRCLMKDPAHRYADGMALSMALSQCTDFGRWRPMPHAKRRADASEVAAEGHPPTRVDRRNPGSVVQEVAGVPGPVTPLP